MTVPAWYFGEVQNRHYGTAWESRPGDEQANPFVRLPSDEEEDELYERFVPACDAVAELTALFLRGPDNHLRDQLRQYTG